MKVFSNFKSSESGAVTVDWVVLTAAIVGIAIAVLTVISGGLGSAASGVDTQVTDAGTSSGISGAILASNTPASSTGFGSTGADYLAANGGDTAAAAAAITADAPAGYYFSGWIDGASGLPLYTANDQQSFLVGSNTYSFNGYWAQANGSHPL